MIADEDSPAILVSAEAGDWAAPLLAVARSAAMVALGTAPVGLGAVELGITLTDDAEVRELNQRFRGRDKPTNVLSFPLCDTLPPAAVLPTAADAAPLMLGDVVLACETVAAEAAAAGKPLADHVAHLVIHGVLHLLGHDHETEAEAEAMERLETRLLAGMGIADPYRERPAGQPDVFLQPDCER